MNTRYDEIKLHAELIANKIHEILNSGDKEWTYDEDEDK